jgi:hypothetical protein
MWRRVTQGIVVAAISAMSAMSAMVLASSVPASAQPVPEQLRPPANNVLLVTARAVGVQIYACQPQVDNPNAFAWTLKGPDATLYNEQGQKIAHHDAGPTWAGNDGSKVVGEVAARVDAHNPHDIPWLLLKATSHEGSGAFSTISYIQRLDTDGGAAPKDGCTRSTANTERSVRYRATYAFYYPASQ